MKKKAEKYKGYKERAQISMAYLRGEGEVDEVH